MKRAPDLITWLKLAVIGLAGLLVACGGGGGSTPASTDTTITGSVVAAPVNGASLLVKDTSGNTLTGPVTTGSDGGYSIAVPNSALSGDLIFEATGGTFPDEATGFTGTAGVLAAHVVAGSLSTGSAVHLTPASTIVRDMVANHGKTYAEAQAAFEAAFGFAADTSVAPADATNPAVGATQAQLLAGLRAAAFSQLTMELGLMVKTATEQFDLLPALARDIAHGGFDGQDAGGTVIMTDSKTTALPADIQNRFNQALVKFHEDKNKNKTGLANDQIGNLPFAKVALSTSYKVEYVPNPMMGAMEGKTMFKVRITDEFAAAVTGKTVTLMPMMNMGSGMMHSSPSDGCTEIGTTGEYACTVYYLMASKMMGGMSMGYWKLMVMIGGMMESATFYPQVMMAMGDTVKATLKGQADMIAGMMMGDENRPYYLFKDGLSGMTDDHTFKLFIAAKESMKSYPAVFVGQSLNNGTAYQLDVAAMSVEFSTDDGATWSFAASDADTNGHWSASGITGLTDGTQGTICVRLTVDDGITNELKTTDGMPDDDTNGHTCFTVTPGGM